MLERMVTVVNDLGLHARPAAKIAQAASRYRADISLRHGDVAANAKSILGVLTLAAPRGSELLICAEGDDAEAALAALAELFSSGFDE